MGARCPASASCPIRTPLAGRRAWRSAAEAAAAAAEELSAPATAAAVLSELELAEPPACASAGQRRKARRRLEVFPLGSVLTYLTATHHLLPHSPSSLALSPALFRRAPRSLYCNDLAHSVCSLMCTRLGRGVETPCVECRSISLPHLTDFLGMIRVDHPMLL